MTLSKGDCLRHLLTTCSCVAPSEPRLQLLYSFMYDIKVMLLKNLPYMANMWSFQSCHDLTQAQVFGINRPPRLSDLTYICP